MTVLHSCSASAHETAIDALSYLLNDDEVPKPAPVVTNASGSLPVISAAAQGRVQVVYFWTELARTRSEVDQAADAWELLALEKCSSLMPSVVVEMKDYWKKALFLRTNNTDSAQLCQILQAKQERCATVASSQTCGPLFGVVELVEADCCEADTIDERIEMMLVPFSELFNCAATESSAERVLRQWCLCSERVLGLSQREVVYSRLAYAKWLLYIQRHKDADPRAAELMLDFMKRQLEELEKGPGTDQFFFFSPLGFLKLWRKEEGFCGDAFKWVGLELVQLTALAVQRCQKRSGNWLEHHCLLVCFLEIVRIFFLSDETTTNWSGADLVDNLDVTVVDAVRRCICTNLRGKYNQTLLHIAMDSRNGQMLTKHKIGTKKSKRFPHVELSLLLVELKAPVNKPDNRGYLPLHLLLESGDDIEDDRVLPIVKCLVRAKPHLCICNWNKESCLDLAKKSSIRDSLMPALREPQPLPLLCLAAQFLLRSYRLMEVYSVFPELVPFVRLH